MEEKNKFQHILKEYLNKIKNPENNKVPELEIRFGGKRDKISKIDFDNVIKYLYNAGFSTNNKDGEYLLRIKTPEINYVDKDKLRKSKDRVEIIGIDLIQSYCQKKEDLNLLFSLPQFNSSLKLVKFTMKGDYKDENDDYLKPVDFNDFGFRVSYQYEYDSKPESPRNKDVVTRWVELKKTFRFLNRVKFTHPTYPINADLSIIRGSRKTDFHEYKSSYNMQEAGVFDNEETYEIELEIDNTRSLNLSPKELMIMVRKTIRIILSGLQCSNYPIGYKEKDQVLDSYMRLIHGTEYVKKMHSSNNDFIGPNSLTLQIDNILKNELENVIPNIRTNYSVTDKADGMRMLLYISKEDKIYLIDTNMNIVFTGVVLNKETKKDFKDTLLDGEFIKHDKNGSIINLFAAFDIYYLNGTYVANLPFKMPEVVDKCRYDILRLFIEQFKFDSVTTTNITDVHNPCHFHIKCKEFEFTFEKSNIFHACKMIESRISDYEKDGLIFTPTNSPAGGIESLKQKRTWNESFKWKPPKFNTIDFLVRIKKNEKGVNAVYNVLIDGEIIQYQTLELMCGFSKYSDGHMNPMRDLINDEIPEIDENLREYKPVKFYPSNPSDDNAHLCNIILKDDVMKTEDGEFFEGDMIIEFKYEITKVGLTNDRSWNWIPIRVRYDKTSELRASMKDKRLKPNFGNSYKVANSNWSSIHNPITENMIFEGKDIPTSSDNGIYYNKTSREETITRNLRDFHNLYVKRRLISGVASQLNENKRTLIDYAVGKGGDLSKWTESKISFVFGIDIKKDNIHNQIDGACARYLNEKKKNPKFFKPKALFVVGNSGYNIRNNSAYGEISGSIDEEISNAVFGIGDKGKLGKAVQDQYGVAVNGFGISSVQFALHYFFKNKDTVHQFMRNICECTCTNGYFIGTCYDGKTIFDKLKISNNNNDDDNIIVMTKDKKRKMLEIRKEFSESGFDDNTPCLGYTINVWMESINQWFPEYLVNFTYLTRLMKTYGFDLITDIEANKMNLPYNTGMFSDLYSKMNSEKNKTDYKGAIHMTDEEKTISFLNRYFVFKKISQVDVNSIQEAMGEIMDLNEMTETKKITRLPNKMIINNTMNMKQDKTEYNGIDNKQKVIFGKTKIVIKRKAKI
jgi:hypothetical protein